jgi:hypothetical protein
VSGLALIAVLAVALSAGTYAGLRRARTEHDLAALLLIPFDSDR